MPFTVSHVAAVLPFARTRLLPAALAIGAIGPDLFTYLPLPVPREFAHSWLGVVTVDLACGIVVYLLWQLLFRRPVIDYSPLWVRSRMHPNKWMPTTVRARVTFALLLVASVLLGTATHVLWDDLTHPGAPGEGLPALTEKLGPLTGYDWLQYASSVLGAAVLVWFVIRWTRRTAAEKPAASPIGERFRRSAWLIVVVAGVLVTFVEWFLFFRHGPGGLDPVLLAHLVVSGLGGSGLAAVILCLVWLVRARRGR